MNNNTKYSRHLRLVGLLMANNTDRRYDAYDLAYMLGVEYVTIQRDFRELRKQGIPIVQAVNSGVTIEGSFNKELLRDYLLAQIGRAYTTSILDIALKQSIHMNELFYLKNFMQILTGIENKNRIAVTFMDNNTRKDLSPHKVFQKESEWYLLASSNADGLQHYAIKDLNMVNITVYIAEEFSDEKIEAYVSQEVFSNFRRGNIKIKLQFAKPNNEGYLPFNNCNCTLTKCNETGNTLLEAEVESIDNVVNWLLKNATDVYIIEPPELISKMKAIIENLIKMTSDTGQIVLFQKSGTITLQDVIEQRSVTRHHRINTPSPMEKPRNLKLPPIKFFKNIFTKKDYTISAELSI